VVVVVEEEEEEEEEFLTGHLEIYGRYRLLIGVPCLLITAIHHLLFLLPSGLGRDIMMGKHHWMLSSR